MGSDGMSPVTTIVSPVPLVALGSVLRRSLDVIALDPTESYRQVTVRLHHRGVALRGIQPGSEIGSTRQYRVRAGQLILSRIDARHGAIGLVPEQLDGAIVTNDFRLFDIDHEQISPQYLDYFVGTPGFVDLCKQASEGSTNRVRLQPERFLGLRIPLPSLAEQRRIVARIDELAAKIEEARGLRRAVEDMTASVHGATALGLFRGDSHRLSQPVETVADVRGGIQKGPHRAPAHNPARYLTVAHVQRDHILLSDPRFFEVSAAELDRWRLLPGDVLIIEGNGSADQIGRAALFRGEIQDCVHQNHVIRIRPDRSKIIPEFLNAYLNSPAGQDEVQAQSRTTSGLRSLSVGRIKQIKVPMPPIIEQHCIVRRLHELQQRRHRLQQLQYETQVELDALLPAVLDRAFWGQI